MRELLKYLEAEADTAVETYVEAHADRYLPSDVAEAAAFAREYVRRLLDFRRKTPKRTSTESPGIPT